MAKREAIQKIEKGIPDNELVFFSFSYADSESSLRWEHSMEFEYMGMMYDVISKKISEDSIRITCYKDIKESRLKKKVQLLFLDHFKNESSSPAHKLLVHFFKTFIFEKIIIHNDQEVYNKEEDLKKVFVSLSETDLEIPKPPPEHKSTPFF